MMSLLRSFVSSLLLLLTACEFGVAPSKLALATCPAPQEGRHYAVCARLSTSVSPGDGSSGDHVEGSLNAGTPDLTGQHHQLLQGTFHASH